MKRLAKEFLKLVATIGTVTVVIVSALAQQSFTGQGRYRVEIVATGKALDLRMEDKKTVQQWAVGGARNQQWDFVDAGNGFYYITSVENGRVLDVDGGRARDGVAIITATRGSSDNQKWKLADNGRGEFTIISKTGKSLESPAGKRDDGVKLQIGEPHALENQRFRLIRVGDVEAKVRPREGAPVGTTPGTMIAHAFAGKGRYQIQNVASSHFLDLRRDDNTTLQQWSGSGGLNQQWDFEDAGNGYFYIRSVESGRVLEVAGSRDGSAVLAKGQQVGRDVQKFRVVDAGSGQSLIVARNGKVLDLTNSARNEGQSLQIWGEHRRDNQRFVFKLVETTVQLSGGRTREARGAGAPSRDAAPVEQPYVPGKMTWRGRVDTEVLLEVRGNIVTEKLVAGKSFNNGQFTFSTPMPARELTLRIENKKVRGTVEVVERPTAANGYTAVIRVRDSQRSAADYEFVLSW
ncbi:MAG: RICIN domain-containing protein [Acidobacteriota bacterium]|nr:RICIN domain-containing protein [Acidobacteriota bacterium]